MTPGELPGEPPGDTLALPSCPGARRPAGWQYSLILKKKKEGLSWWLSGKESRLLMQETWAPSQIQEDPTCCVVTERLYYNY